MILLVDFQTIFQYLNRTKSMNISRALLEHGYSAFSLTIIEYIDVSGFSKADSKELILKREQHFIDTLAPDYFKNCW